MPNKRKPYWFKWQHVFFKDGKGWTWKDWVWKNRYKTEKSRDEAMKSISKKGHSIIGIGCD